MKYYVVICVPFKYEGLEWNEFQVHLVENEFNRDRKTPEECGTVMPGRFDKASEAFLYSEDLSVLDQVMCS